MQYYALNQRPDDRILVYEVDSDPLSLDPACCTDYIGQLILQALYEPLFVRNQQTGDWQLGAAERYEVSEDRMVYTFYLSKDKRWSDGTPVVAEDFVFALRRLVNPLTKSPYQINLAPLLNADEILEGLVPIHELGAVALDEWTLQIKLAYPISYLEALLGMFSASPLPSHKQSGESTFFTVSNGPFSFAEHSKGKHVLLMVNPYFSKVTELSVAGIRFQINRDIDRSMEDYQVNNVHITCNTYFPFDRISEAKTYADFYQEPSSVMFLLQMNRHRHEIFKDRRVRELLYQAIDKEKIASRLQGGVIPWNHFIPKGLLTPEIELPRKQTECSFKGRKALCQESGLPFPSITILFSDYYPNSDVLELIVEMWKNQLGLSVSLEKVSFEKLIRRSQLEDYDICLRLLAPAHSEPLGCYLYYLPDLEDESEKQEQMIDLLELAMDDVEKRSAAYSEVDRLLQEELPVLPLFNGYSFYFVNPALQGYRMFSDGSVCFRDLKWT